MEAKGPWGCQPLRPLHVGPKSKNKPRKTEDESSDSSSPHAHDHAAYRCTRCDRVFDTKTGLGVHTKRAHPSKHDQAKNRTVKKARWNSEEVALVARKEAQLISEGKARFYNLALFKAFPHRTQEAIKKIRQQEAYRDAIQVYLKDIQKTSKGKPTTDKKDKSQEPFVPDDQVAGPSDVTIAKNARWTPSEITRLVNEEARLVYEGETRIINQALFAFYKARTLESIKNIHTRAEYKRQVVARLGKLRQSSPAKVHNEPPSSPSSSSHAESSAALPNLALAKRRTPRLAPHPHHPLKMRLMPRLLITPMKLSDT
ncbi:unnamed protein product [Ceutorhynchus assimilis]|uniref:C2H2-type domain-containing protein n=1 Tax=Ceutorhynchus assimilis TaxID=467358 RepID=A0A9N9MR36_9CUCU|nr:unnamed protein product [Ceutorhynchus assimilis]